jgi:PQQ-dependent dehydrogenase (methanol/ethanol family)
MRITRRKARRRPIGVGPTLALLAGAAFAAPPPALPLPASPASVAPASTTAPTDAELLAPADGDWPMYNRDYPGSRYSPLAQITAANAATLRPVCILQLGVPGAFMSSPVFYGGVGYVTTVRGVQAFDGATCQRKWAFTYAGGDPESAMQNNRGLALYDGKVFRGTTDGHLIALDAATGKLLWDAKVADTRLGYAVGLAPIAYRGRVYVGLSGGDLGAPGHIFAFDARTGERLWTFDAIPHPGAPGSETWGKGLASGGGATWTSFALDPREGLLYAPIGNPAPDFLRSARPGANLYTNSVVALDAASGKLSWYVQQRPADYHDWDTAAPPVLYEENGRRLMAVGSKDGFVYIYDRQTHALVARTPVTTLKNTEVPLSRLHDTHVCPGWAGGVEWYGPAHHPGLKTLYVGAVDWCGAYRLEPPTGYKPGAVYLEGAITMDAPQSERGWVYALDGTTGKPLWSYHAPGVMLAGVAPTAGDVVFAGGGDGDFLALGAKTGQVLYRFHTGGTLGGGISTYLAGGRQYVAASTGSNSMLPFGLGGTPTVVVFGLP